MQQHLKSLDHAIISCTISTGAISFGQHVVCLQLCAVRRSPSPSTAEVLLSSSCLFNHQVPGLSLLLRILTENAGKAVTIHLADTHRAKLQSSTASTLAICLLDQESLNDQWLYISYNDTELRVLFDH